MEHLLRPLGLFAVLQLGVHTLAWACSCGEPPPVSDAFADAGQVFFGEVQSVSPRPLGCLASGSDQARTVVFAVEDAWKGATIGETTSFETALSEASCGVDFAVGETWLVYTSQGEATLCSRTRLASSDDPELSELDALENR